MMPDPTYNKESPRYPEVADRDARLVGHEPKGKEMTKRVDHEAVEATINRLHESKAGKDVRVDAMHTIRTLLAERDALEAENQKLREALTSIASNSCCDRCQEAALVARTALAVFRAACGEGK